METLVSKAPFKTVSEEKVLSEAALQAVTGEMITAIAEKLVTAVEMADDLIQPETIALLKILPEVSSSLERTLLELKKLEDKGTLTTLFELVGMVQCMKSGLTGAMITDLMEKAVNGVEIADSLAQMGVIDLAEDMVSAFDHAKDERQGKEPMTLIQIVRSLSDKQTREGLSMLITFVQKLSK